MTEQTIKYLKDLKNGESFILTKDRPDEISELIVNLKNLGILHKPTKYGFACDFKNRRYLTKLIELKSWSEFTNWLDGQNTDANIINDFSGSTIGQVNQADFLKNKKTKIKQIIHHKTHEKQENAMISFVEKFWWQILIPLAIGIVSILIERKIIDIGL